MLHKIYTTFLAAFVVASFASTASAQFENQKNYAGAHIGLSGVGSALTLGLDYERGITDIGQVGPGIIGLGGLFDYYSYSYFETVKVTYIDLGVSGMYHFVLDNKKLDPFLGSGSRLRNHILVQHLLWLRGTIRWWVHPRRQRRHQIFFERQLGTASPRGIRFLHLSSRSRLQVLS